MATVSNVELGETLATWLASVSGAETVKSVAKDVSFDLGSFFGSDKRKTKLTMELVIVNCALAIHAVNTRHKTPEAKEIIDAFLKRSSATIFNDLQSRNSGFRSLYEKRMGEYFPLFGDQNPLLALSFAFLVNLDLSPLENLEGQLSLVERFGNAHQRLLTTLGPEDKRKASTAKEVATDLQGLLRKAREAGDRKKEAGVLLLILQTELLIARQALDRITDLVLDERTTELQDDLTDFFPVPLTVAFDELIEALEQEGASEILDDFASQVGRLADQVLPAKGA